MLVYIGGVDSCFFICGCFFCVVVWVGWGGGGGVGVGGGGGGEVANVIGL